MKARLTEVLTEDLRAQLNQDDFMLIDVRPTEAYNGWKIREEVRGGHIRGARSLPVKWAEYIDWIEIVRQKEIVPQHKIVLYGYTDEDVFKVAERFYVAGYHDLGIYRGFLAEWSVNDKLPMDQMVNYRHLVYPEWLNTLISGGIPPGYENGSNYVICHAHYRNYQDYLDGHIPGSIALDTLALESPETWNRRSPLELKMALEKHGICNDTTVILYGRYSFPNNDDPFPGSAAGHLGAIRCALIMMYAGVKDVRVLNGGMAAWEAEQQPQSMEPVKFLPVADFGVSIPARPELFVDMEEAKKMIASDDGDLVCTRSWSEYIGKTSGYNYIEKKGRIPGAVYVKTGSDAYHMEQYQNLDYTTREYHEIEAIWAEKYLFPEKHLAYYCGTGWRGSEVWFNAWLLGWPRVSVFDGGWFEWSNDPQNPIETGAPDSSV